ncbi:phosphoglycerate dehydrogenase [Helicobacter turcicus]|uniref:D-3-phosphoglycerate dehydrogenase n=1 Tax=Helicobacter turcicus TaxID=2867412 RepID=A0ABS7JLL2_9HELI|nr:phosphoglycerate dehydrogenase [Helicobacter turcicus]MBX7490289.1 phosphoglycerate dehydrogenase [Helicobacter turcicus]MBX7545132.1 phosphoglycerate dehydrogenase [Helicobacter turcicus]
MSKYTIIVCDHIHRSGLDLLAKDSEVTLLNLADLPKDELKRELYKADVAITRSSTEVNIDFLDSASKLRAVVRAGVGVDNVDIENSSKRGVVVMNVPTANTIAAVELTCAHILSAIRNFPDVNTQLKVERKWKREDWYGTELKGKKLGIIGFGNIGSRVGKRMKAFEMEVIAYDPYINPTKATDIGIAYTRNFDDILSCDIITIHTPKNKETINMIDTPQIAKMKDGVILINCARGGLYNEDALEVALKSKKVRWAGIDVFTKEPATSNKLLDAKNIYVTPHIGANTLESQEKIAVQAAQAALEAARGSSFPNALNLPIKENELPSFMKAYLELMQKMAFFAIQVNKDEVRSVTLEAEGEIKEYLSSLSTFALVGILNATVGDKVNYVNAPYVAQERGIEIKLDGKESKGIYKNQIKLTLLTQKGTFSVSGTVFNENTPKIVNINNFALDIEPKGKMILFRNNDTPGVIGFIGTTLAKHNINIADFRLGRYGKEALALIVVDDAVSQNVLDELSSLEDCISIKYAVL